MRQRLSSLFTNIKDKWNETETANKVKVVIAVAACVLVLFAMIFYAARPRMVPVLQGLSYVDGMDGVAVLSSAGISSEFSGGELRVREADVSMAAYELTNSDISALNSPDTSFTDAMNLLSMGQTSAIQRDVMINQKQRELENSLTMFDGVTAAKVNIVLADDTRVFMRNEQESSISVTLTTNKDLSSAAGQAMARYLCKSLKGLTMENIEITNQNYQTIYSGTKMSADGYAEAYDIEAMKKSELVNTVKGFVGGMYSDVSVLATLDMNFDRIVQQMRRYEDPNPNRNDTGYAIESQMSSSSVTGADSAGDVGMDANDQMAPGYQMGSNNAVEANTKDEMYRYVYDEIFTETEQAAGVINYNNSSLSVRLTRNQEHFEDDLPIYIENNNLPEETTWSQYKNSIPAFVQNPMTPEIETLAAAIRVGTSIPNVDIITYTQNIFHDTEAPTTPYQNYIMFGVLILLILLLLYGFIRQTKEDEIESIDPELAVEDILASTQHEMEKEEVIEESLAAIAFTQENEAMRQIENFINERPEAVAQLLRNWINEEWE